MKTKLLLIVFIILGGAACDKKSVKPLGQSPIPVAPPIAESTAEFCTKDPEGIAKDVYTLFIIDRSASNIDGNPGDDIGTDPERKMRYQGMIDLFDPEKGYEFKETEYFSLMEFYCPNGCSGGNQVLRNGQYYDRNGDGVVDEKDRKVEPISEGSHPVLVNSEDLDYPFVKNTDDQFLDTVKQAQSAADVSNRGTPYHSTLQRAYDLIVLNVENKIKKYDEEVRKVLEEGGKEEDVTPPEPGIYKIIFITDGFPTDVIKDHADRIEGDSSELYKKWLYGDGAIIPKIVNLRDDPAYGQYIENLFLRAAFYNHDQIPESQLRRAMNLLDNMSIAGNTEGALSFVSGDPVDFRELIDIPIKQVKTSLVDFMVTNINVQWGTPDLISGKKDDDDDNKDDDKSLKDDEPIMSPIRGTQLVADTDADGISDLNEILLGSDPNDWDSDDNGVPDGIELMLYKEPCNIDDDGECDMSFKNISDETCIDSRTKKLKDEDKDKDGLVKCWEQLLDTDDRQFDSNGDGIPDDLALMRGISLVEVGNSNNKTPAASTLDNDTDGKSDYWEIKHLTPRIVSNGTVKGLKPIDYSQFALISKDITNGVSCYEATIKDIPFLSPEDKVKAYIIEREEVAGGRLFIRTAIKQINPDGSAQFFPEDFKDEEDEEAGKD